MSEQYGVAQFVSAATLVKKYPMVIHTIRNIPFLLAAEGQGEVHNQPLHVECVLTWYLLQNVVGEVYDVDAKMLARLDVLEDHPNRYTRTTLDCSLQATDGQIVSAQVYMLHNYNRVMLNEPFLADYKTHAHTRPYVHRENMETTNPEYNILDHVKEQV